MQMETQESYRLITVQSPDGIVSFSLELTFMEHMNNHITS